MTVAFIKLADSRIYMADHYTKSTRFHDADNDKVVCRICMDAVRVSGTVVPGAVFSENDFIWRIPDVHILHRKSLIKVYLGFPI